MRHGDLLIKEWAHNLKLWRDKLRATNASDYSYRSAVKREIRRCIKRIRTLKELQN